MQRPRTAELPYEADTAPRFAVLAGRPWSIFLDSGRPYTNQGRYDIFAADPYFTLSTRGQETEIWTRHSIQVSVENPFYLVKRCLEAPRTGAPSVPFSGGAMGYFAYDLGRRLEKLPAVAANDITLPDMAIGFYDWAVIVDHVEKRAFVVGY